MCSWFELDQHEVLDLKSRLLAAAGAGKKHGTADKYPLQAASYVSAVVDLNNSSWVETLKKAGMLRFALISACLSASCLVLFGLAWSY